MGECQVTYPMQGDNVWKRTLIPHKPMGTSLDLINAEGI